MAAAVRAALAARTTSPEALFAWHQVTADAVAAVGKRSSASSGADLRQAVAACLRVSAEAIARGVDEMSLPEITEKRAVTALIPFAQEPPVRAALVEQCCVHAPFIVGPRALTALSAGAANLAEQLPPSVAMALAGMTGDSIVDGLFQERAVSQATASTIRDAISLLEAPTPSRVLDQIFGADGAPPVRYPATLGFTGPLTVISRSAAQHPSAWAWIEEGLRATDPQYASRALRAWGESGCFPRGWGAVQELQAGRGPSQFPQGDDPQRRHLRVPPSMATQCLTWALRSSLERPIAARSDGWSAAVQEVRNRALKSTQAGFRCSSDEIFQLALIGGAPPAQFDELIKSAPFTPEFTFPLVTAYLAEPQVMMRDSYSDEGRQEAGDFLSYVVRGVGQPLLEQTVTAVSEAVGREGITPLLGRTLALLTDVPTT
jgi:hypothetical protein